MSNIFETQTNKIQKVSNNKYKFVFENGEKFNHFYKKTWRFLDIKNRNQTNFTFTAENVMPLNKFLKSNNNVLTYSQAKWLFLDISKQYEGLEKDGYGNLYIDIKDIVCIFLKDIEGRNGENTFYLYLNSNTFFEKKSSNLEITKPLKKNKYFSPEMFTVRTFPSLIPYTTCYYSLALLIVDILSTIDNIELTKPNFQTALKEYNGSKLYYSLMRCLEDDPNNRYFLFI